MRLRNNYFGESYLSLDVRDGILHNPAGTRLITLSEDFLLGFRKALIEETGQAHHIVFETCGQTWGENMVRRLEKEISEYYDCPFKELPMSMFTLLLKDCWTRHGWGELEIDWEEGFKQGLFAVKIINPAFSAIFSKAEEDEEYSGKNLNDDVFTGLLSAFFSRFADQKLVCYQIGHAREDQLPVSWFITGVAERLKKVPDLVRSGKSPELIYQQVGAFAQ